TNHIPTTAACAQCHTTAGNFALYSVTGVHQGITGCLSCHGSNTGPFAGPPPSNTITVVGVPANHFPVGSLDCNRSGCHSASNVSPGGFKLGSASLTAPTLSVAGHTTVAAAVARTPSNHFPVATLDCNGSGCHSASNVSPGGFKLGSASLTAPTLSVAGHTTVAAAVAACQTCHETAPYLGMIASSATAWGDSRPQAFDKVHPVAGDCNGCHTTTPTFATDMTPSAKPANHIPTTAPCTQCHTTANDYAQYSSPGTHQGVTGCLSCHGSTVATTFATITRDT